MNAFISISVALLTSCLTPRARVASDNDVTLTVSPEVLDGTNPGIKVTGLNSDETVRVHVLRSLGKWQQRDGNWERARQPLHAWADFSATTEGTIDVDSARPVRGTYSEPDAVALLRTGYRFGDDALASVVTFPVEPLDAGSVNTVWVKLERNGAVTAEANFELIDTARGVKVVQKSGDGWHAVYAWPEDGTNLPIVISLHGSEGGSVDKARGRALPFASRGFAAVGVNYFAYSYEAIEGVPTNHSEIKLEVLQSIRDWLSTRTEVDLTKIHLIGGSKGAEFALLAATKFDWMKSVVAVVPSDVVWEGYSEGGGVGTGDSSWSIGGTAVPFVPLFQFDPNDEGMYRTNTERYERSRSFHPDEAARARIPVEKIKADVLLLASDRDEVWASGAMARNIVERMTAAGKGDLVSVRIYPKAGHQLAGTGTFPIRLYNEQSADADAKDIVAEGTASADAWQKTLRFLNR